MTSRVLLVGAGWSSAVCARTLAEDAQISSLVIERRPHIGGNCHTARDPETGVMVHTYGPHIFHTNDAALWAYVRRFGIFRPYVHRVRAVTAGGVYTFPINLHTINQFFGVRLTPAQAVEFVRSRAVDFGRAPANFEEQALSLIGRDLYEAFIAGYTAKQWGCPPSELPASVFTRLPVRYNYDDAYHHCAFSGIPEEGYTAVIARILDHPLIEVRVSTPWAPDMAADFEHVFFTGALDEYFDHAEGRLSYRTVSWNSERGTGDLQGIAQLNFPEAAVPWTRTIEPAHFSTWEHHERSVLLTEFSRDTGPTDEPYYPKRLERDLALLHRYRRRAGELDRVTFLGRLATYRYLDMERVIAEGLSVAHRYLAARTSGTRPPVFADRDSELEEHTH